MSRYERFMRGKNAENLAGALEENFRQVENRAQSRGGAAQHYDDIS